MLNKIFSSALKQRPSQRHLSMQSYMRFSTENEVVRINLEKYAELLHKHNVDALNGVAPPESLSSHDMKTLNVTQADSSLDRIAKNYVTMTKYFADHPQRAERTGKIKDAYLNIISYKVAIYNDLTPTEQTELEVLLNENLKLVPVPTTENRQELAAELLEESATFQWEEPRYINWILFFSWITIGYVSFDLVA